MSVVESDEESSELLGGLVKVSAHFRDGFIWKSIGLEHFTHHVRGVLRGRVDEVLSIAYSCFERLPLQKVCQQWGRFQSEGKKFSRIEAFKKRKCGWKDGT